MVSAYVRLARQSWQMRAGLTQKSCSITIVGPLSAFDSRAARSSGPANLTHVLWVRPGSQIARARADFDRFSEMSENRRTGWWSRRDLNPDESPQNLEFFGHKCVPKWLFRYSLPHRGASCH